MRIYLGWYGTSVGRAIPSKCIACIVLLHCLLVSACRCQLIGLVLRRPSYISRTALYPTCSCPPCCCVICVGGAGAGKALDAMLLIATHASPEACCILQAQHMRI
jgi:hypothetical protein